MFSGYESDECIAVAGVGGGCCCNCSICNPKHQSNVTPASSIGPRNDDLLDYGLTYVVTKNISNVVRNTQRALLFEFDFKYVKKLKYEHTKKTGKEVHITESVWVPISQIRSNGLVSEWFMKSNHPKLAEHIKNYWKCKLKLSESVEKELKDVIDTLSTTKQQQVLSFIKEQL